MSISFMIFYVQTAKSSDIVRLFSFLSLLSMVYKQGKKTVVLPIMRLYSFAAAALTAPALFIFHLSIPDHSLHGISSAGAALAPINEKLSAHRFIIKPVLFIVRIRI